jgi:hypothetical protein
MTDGQGNGSEIVYTWSDNSCATGDRYLRTADGTVWKQHLSPLGPPGTGETRGYVRDGKVYR